MNNYNKFLTKALDKMFQAVGFEKFDKEFSDADGWYNEKTWTKDQSADFKKWFITEGELPND